MLAAAPEQPVAAGSKAQEEEVQSPEASDSSDDSKTPEIPQEITVLTDLTESCCRQDPITEECSATGESACDTPTTDVEPIKCVASNENEVENKCEDVCHVEVEQAAMKPAFEIPLEFLMKARAETESSDRTVFSKVMLPNCMPKTEPVSKNHITVEKSSPIVENEMEIPLESLTKDRVVEVENVQNEVKKPEVVMTEEEVYLEAEDKEIVKDEEPAFEIPMEFLMKARAVENVQNEVKKPEVVMTEEEVYLEAEDKEIVKDEEPAFEIPMEFLMKARAEEASEAEKREESHIEIEEIVKTASVENVVSEVANLSVNNLSGNYEEFSEMEIEEAKIETEELPTACSDPTPTNSNSVSPTMQPELKRVEVVAVPVKSPIQDVLKLLQKEAVKYRNIQVAITPLSTFNNTLNCTTPSTILKFIRRRKHLQLPFYL